MSDRSCQCLSRPIRALFPCTLLFVAALLVGPVSAQVVSGYRAHSEKTPQASVIGVSPGTKSSGSLRPLVVFAPAVVGAPDRLAELIERNAMAAGATQVGFVRGQAEATFAFDGFAATKDSGTSRIDRYSTGVVFSARVRVEQAWAVRIRLDDIVLPGDAQIWVVAEADGTRAKPFVLGPFGRELVDPAGGMWLPAAPGPEVTVEVHVPRSASRSAAKVSFAVTDIAELFDLDDPWLREAIHHTAQRGWVGKGSSGGDWESCRIDATCVERSELEAIENLREAVAWLMFMEGDSFFACTGTLLADELYTGTPYLLTANHCFSTQASASSLTSYFDYRTDVCDGTKPSLLDVPQVSGSVLLTTTATNDLTLVQLLGVPTGDVHFMGWTPERPVHGEVMHSVTHPGGRPQTWATSTYIGAGQPSVCGGGINRTHFHLSMPLQGTTYFGSSGGSQILDRDGGLVIGQILGFCRLTPYEFCDGSTYVNITGSFEYNYERVRHWLGDQPGQPVDDSIFADGFESGDTSAW